MTPSLPASKSPSQDGIAADVQVVKSCTAFAHDSMQQHPDSVLASAKPEMRHQNEFSGDLVVGPHMQVGAVCQVRGGFRRHLWRKPASGSIRSDTRMNWSTELFQDLVQIADSFHSVASGRRWFCIAILHSQRSMRR